MLQVIIKGIDIEFMVEFVSRVEDVSIQLLQNRQAGIFRGSSMSVNEFHCKV